jgi:hypothetical protein
MRRHALAGQRHEIRIGHVAVAVRIGQPARFAEQVDALRRQLAIDRLVRAMSLISSMPSICAMAMPPDDGGGAPHTVHAL